MTKAGIKALIKAKMIILGKIILNIRNIICIKMMKCVILKTVLEKVVSFL